MRPEIVAWCHQQAAGCVSWWHQRLKLQLWSFSSPSLPSVFPFFFFFPRFRRDLLHIRLNYVPTARESKVTGIMTVNYGSGRAALLRCWCTNHKQSIIVTLIWSWDVFWHSGKLVEPLKVCFKIGSSSLLIDGCVDSCFWTAGFFWSLSVESCLISIQRSRSITHVRLHPPLCNCFKIHYFCYVFTSCPHYFGIFKNRDLWKK